MDKKTGSKNLNPLPIIGKSNKKGKKTAEKDFEAQLGHLIDEEHSEQINESSSSQPRLNKLRKIRNVEKQKQRQIKERQIEKKSESEDIDEQKSESESEQQFQRFHNANDQEIQKLNQKDKKKSKKGSKKASKKQSQQLARFIQRHKNNQKSKEQSNEKIEAKSKPKQYIQTSLQALFQKGAQPKKPEIVQKMQDQNNKQSSQQQDSLQMHRKRLMMQNLNGGLTDDQALKIALKQSTKDIKPIQTKQIKPKQAPKPKQVYQPIKQCVSLDNYAFQNINKSKKILEIPIQQKKLVQKKQQPLSKPKQPQKNKQEKKQKLKSKKKQKSDNDEKKGVLSGLGIVITGQIQPYSKTQILQMLQQLGALIPHSITKKTTHLLQGNVVKNQFGRPTGQDVRTTGKSVQAAQKNVKIIPYQQLDDFFMQKTGKTLSDLMNRNKPKKQFNPLQKYIQIKNPDKTAAKNQMQQEAPHSQTQQIIVPQKGSTSSQTWTQKYKPRSSEQIIGQNSQIKDLKQWLTVWQDIHIHGNKRDVKPNFNSFLPSGTINSNAVLISGDAGLGKTTTARLIAAQFGYSVVQYNASDARNKKSVELISMGKNNMAFMGNKKQQINKTLIIMDQVDGMSSGDRGGISAIIDMIKKTKVPIICICNDRQATKIRSLAGHCYDIKYHKPNKKMVADRLADIIKNQGGQSNPIALQRLVQLLQNDMRQCLNYVELLFKSGVRNFSTDIIEKRCSNTKDSGLTLNFFEATKTLLTRTMFMGMKISERTQLAFVDSDMVPLMVQQNYLSACPKKKMNRKQFHKFTKATQGFVKADLIDRTIMKNQNYCLMPNKMFLSCIYPCQMICQSLGFPKFTQWLGKFSAQRKNKRLIRQIKYSLGCVTPVTSFSVKHHFVAMLYQRICQQLRVSQPDTEKIVKFMFHYGLTPTILTQNLCSLQYGERPNIYKDIETSKKTKLTKMYNKMHQTLKFKKQKSKIVVEHIKYDPVLGQMNEQNDQDQNEQEGQNQESNQQVILDKKAAKSKPKKKK